MRIKNNLGNYLEFYKIKLRILYVEVRMVNFKYFCYII